MDREKLERRRSIRLIISESVMVLAVILTVVILALLVSGYWINSDFEFERQGMLQIYSIPTGANVAIDGETSWLQRTNTSKVLSSGEHYVVLSKDGYDTWSKTINISDGLLYKVHYPRLFLTNRKQEKLIDDNAATFATVSPDHSKILLVNMATKWSIINLEREKISPETIDIAAYSSGVSLAEGANLGLFSGQIVSANWAKDNSHLLLKVRNDNSLEWILLDIDNIENSVNLTRDFNVDFSQIEIIDDSANNLLVIKDHNLHKVNISSKQLSSVLVENIFTFDHYENEIVFVAQKNDAYYLGLTKLSNNETTKLTNLNNVAKVIVSKFYDTKYIATIVGNEFSLYDEQGFSLVFDASLTFEPKSIKAGEGGSFIVMSADKNLAVFDMETRQIIEWSVDGDTFDWLDGSMVYSVNEGKLIVYDYDGLNRRELAKNVSGHFPVTITDNKWLYYFSDNELIREWLIPR